MSLKYLINESDGGQFAVYIKPEYHTMQILKLQKAILALGRFDKI